MAQSLPTARQGLGEPQQKGARVLAPRINPPHAQKTLQSGLNSPDRLLGNPKQMISPGAPELVVHSLGSTVVTLRPARQLRSNSVPKLSNIVVHDWYIADRSHYCRDPALRSATT